MILSARLYPYSDCESRICNQFRRILLTHSTRTTRSLIALTCALLLGLSISAQAQGLKTNSGSFGSGWQVGSAGGDAGGGYGSTGTSTSADAAGSPASAYGGYSGSSNSAGTTGAGASAYSGYSSTYGSASAPPVSAAPSTSTDTPYSAPRSAGGGLRAQ